MTEPTDAEAILIERQDATLDFKKQLFELPEYEIAFARFVQTATNELMIRKSPLLSRIKSEPFSDIPISRNTMLNGEVIENNPISMQMPFAIDFNDVIAGSLISVTTSIDRASEIGLSTLIPQVYDYMGRLCRGAGTAFDANGEKLSHELILKGFERLEINFDDSGQPEMPTLFTSPKMAEAIRALPPATEEQTKAWNAMIDGKRKEFNDRRRRRQLS